MEAEHGNQEDWTVQPAGDKDESNFMIHGGPIHFSQLIEGKIPMRVQFIDMRQEQPVCVWNVRLEAGVTIPIIADKEQRRGYIPYEGRFAIFHVESDEGGRYSKLRLIGWQGTKDSANAWVAQANK